MAVWRPTNPWMAGKDNFMTYEVPAPTPDPKHRYVVVTDAAEIAAIIRNDTLDCPDGECRDGVWYATLDSLRKFRGEQQEIDV